MKKLLTLALIGVFSTITLSSCSNTGTSDLYPEGINQTKQSEMKVSAKESKMTREEEEVFSELQETLQGVGYGNEYEYSGRWKLLCHTSWTSSTGNACFETPLGNYNIHWEPLYNGSHGNGIPVSYEFNPIIFSGSWGCRC